MRPFVGAPSWLTSSLFYPSRSDRKPIFLLSLKDTTIPPRSAKWVTLCPTESADELAIFEPSRQKGAPSNQLAWLPRAIVDLRGLSRVLAINASGIPQTYPRNMKVGTAYILQEGDAVMDVEEGPAVSHKQGCTDESKSPVTSVGNQAVIGDQLLSSQQQEIRDLLFQFRDCFQDGEGPPGVSPQSSITSRQGMSSRFGKVPIDCHGRFAK